MTLSHPIALRVAALAALYAGMEQDGIPPGDVGRLVRELHAISEDVQREADAVLLRAPDWYGRNFM